MKYEDSVFYKETNPTPTFITESRPAAEDKPHGDYINFFDALSVYPFSLIVGNMRTGKSLYAVALARMFEAAGFNIYTNFKLYNIRYRKIDPEKDLNPDSDTLRDGVLFWDEIKATGGNKYDFFTDESRDITEFCSQVGKRNIAIFLISQRWNYGVKDLRELISFIYEITKGEQPGFVRVHRWLVNNNGIDSDKAGLISVDRKPLLYDLRENFEYYDTGEIITSGSRVKRKAEAKKAAEEEKTKSRRKKVIGNG